MIQIYYHSIIIINTTVASSILMLSPTCARLNATSLSAILAIQQFFNYQGAVCQFRIFIIEVMPFLLGLILSLLLTRYFSI